MLSKCANPGCFAKFRYLHDGRVYRVEPDAPHLPRAHQVQSNGYRGHDILISSNGSDRSEYFWLCSTCAERMTLAINHRGVVLIPFLAVRAAAA